ncbi:MAG: hypothetical protein KA886_05805 [Candidatus Cloacimonetes bacterium]|nr:hypothetical protein [Candidatus Cloacimonadota bacterium]
MNSLLEAIRYSDNKIRLKKVETDFFKYLDENLNHENAILSYPVINQLMYLYDSIFFDCYLVKNLEIAIDLSRRMTRSAGITKFNRRTRHFEIVFSIPLLLHTFKENKGRSFDVNGLPCSSPAQALMRVMEHELVHVLEFVLKGNSSCSKQDFRIIAWRLFGHTQTRHAITNENQAVIKKSEFPVGQKVSFEYEQVEYQGVIHRITKRATVMVPSVRGTYLNEAGKRFAKFYVPLSMLKKINE